MKHLALSEMNGNTFYSKSLGMTLSVKDNKVFDYKGIEMPIDDLQVDTLYVEFLDQPKYQEQRYKEYLTSVKKTGNYSPLLFNS
jgi:hypothetical protein